VINRREETGEEEISDLDIIKSVEEILNKYKRMMLK